MSTYFAKKMVYAIPVIANDNAQTRAEYEARVGEPYDKTPGFYWLGVLISAAAMLFATLAIGRANFGWFQPKPIVSEEETYKSAVSCAINSCGNLSCLNIYGDLFPNGTYKERLAKIIYLQKEEQKCRVVPSEIPHEDQVFPLVTEKVPVTQPAQPVSGNILSNGNCSMNVTGGTVI